MGRKAVTTNGHFPTRSRTQEEAPPDQRATLATTEGPSGCGKSTLLSILGLLDSPTAGDYTLNGQPVAQLSQAEAGADP